MNQVPVKLGPLALLLTVISICLTTLAILTFSTARADVRLAERYAETVTQRYALISEGQTFLRDASDTAASGLPLSAIPGTTQDPDGSVQYESESDGMQLSVRVREMNGELQTTEFSVTKEWAEDLDIGNLWGGF